MTKQKTAVQMAINELNSEWSKNGMGARVSYSSVIHTLEKHLPTEKQQIKQAYADGVCDGKIPNAKIKTQEKYFNEKFE